MAWNVPVIDIFRLPNPVECALLRTPAAGENDVVVVALLGENFEWQEAVSHDVCTSPDADHCPLCDLRLLEGGESAQLSAPRAIAPRLDSGDERDLVRAPTSTFARAHAAEIGIIDLHISIEFLGRIGL